MQLTLLKTLQQLSIKRYLGAKLRQVPATVSNVRKGEKLICQPFINAILQPNKKILFKNLKICAIND